MARILYFDSKNIVRFIKTKVIDGCVIIENKLFMVDQSNPLYFKKPFGGYEPMWLVKWSDVIPSENVNPVVSQSSTQKNPEEKLNTTLKKLDRIEPLFKDFRNDISPEMLRKMMGMKILGNMIKTTKPIPAFLIALMGVVVGGLIFFLLMKLNIITF